MERAKGCGDGGEEGEDWAIASVERVTVPWKKGCNGIRWIVRVVCLVLCVAADHLAAVMLESFREVSIAYCTHCLPRHYGRGQDGLRTLRISRTFLFAVVASCGSLL